MTPLDNTSGQENAHSSVPFSKRAVKKAPSPRPDELKERRRKLFLKNVRDGRDEKRFERRGEDVSIYLVFGVCLLSTHD